ncbi:MAG: hypothetical protein E7557_03020 [Ruminococcaceae bacterium]|nr:hypothetical protein [Oscillospiraceae bacterium]
MKKTFSFLLVIIISVSVFASCSNGDNKTNSPTENTTEANQNTEAVTIFSRNNQEPLEIIYDKQILSTGDTYSSEVRFWVSDAILENHPQSELWAENASRNFSVTFISDITATEDFSATLGDASVVTKFTELEKCVLGNGKMVYYYDESWYDEFRTRYYLYEKDDDLIKFTFKEQVSDEHISFILGLFEF